MLKINRANTDIPSSLFSDRAKNARRAIEQVLILSPELRAQRRAPIEPDVYLAEDVRQSLTKLFFGKCAFCESEIGSASPVIVHHFRPTSNANDSRDYSSDTHYYAWFAYEWGNLYPACPDCDRSKSSYFPVSGVRAPLLCSLDEARQVEAGTILDPCHEEPLKHLNFKWNGVAVGSSAQGGITIEAFALNRPTLVQKRLEAGRLIYSRLRSILTPGIGIDPIREVIADDRPHASALRSLLDIFVEELAEQLGKDVPRHADPLWRLSDLLKDAGDGDLEKCFQQIDRLATLSDPTVLAEAVAYPPRPYAARAQPVRDGPTLQALGHSPSSITIRNFKGIENLILKLSERRDSADGSVCLMLLGENATGKSSILEAIALSLLGAPLAATVAGLPSGYLRRKNTQRWALVDVEAAEIRVEFHGMSRASEIRIDPVRQTFEGTEEPSSVVIGYGPRRFFAKSRSFRSRNPAARIKSLFDPLATIADPALWLQRLSGSNFNSVARALREILSLHVSDEIVRDPQLGVCVRANGFLTPLERMSEGYKSLFAMAVDIMRELMRHWTNLEQAAAVVLIDEIETHLHPRWKMRVMSSLRRALPKVTFVATTHDPLCLRGLDDGEVQVLHRDENQNIGLLVDLPSIKGMRAEQLLTSDYFGLSSTADPTIEAKLVDYAAAVATRPADRTPEEEAELLRVGQELAETLTIGDTAIEQVVQEAVVAYLDSRLSAPAALRSEARRNAVSAVLTAFKTPPKV